MEGRNGGDSLRKMFGETNIAWLKVLRTLKSWGMRPQVGKGDLDLSGHTESVGRVWGLNTSPEKATETSTHSLDLETTTLLRGNCQQDEKSNQTGLM